ncbi:MAG: glycosyltransferase family 8 protein [Endomicrobium sp.]|jgi:lipopolysaccharide biosynthesis glycosyltransferase|nr:glycosyltransferase family 8 protein [Endomicrobium sp.]
MINVVFGLDDNFAKHCGATIVSILDNHKMDTENDKIHFFILGNLSQDNKNKFLELKKIQNFEMDFIGIDINEFRGLPVLKFISLATYNRLLIPELLPENVEKAIYLDCDIIVKKDISLLWNINVKEHLIAAVSDNYGYFNAGVLMFNIKALREFDFYNKWKEYVKHNEVVWVDQDILNAVLAGRVLYIPPNWNLPYGTLLKKGKYYNRKYLKTFISFSYIIHFSASDKPWHALCPHPLKKYYFKYAFMTPWKNEIKQYSAFIVSIEFIKKLFKYWLAHPIFFIKPKFWQRLNEKGYLMAIF